MLPEHELEDSDIRIIARFVDFLFLPLTRAIDSSVAVIRAR